MKPIRPKGMAARQATKLPGIANEFLDHAEKIMKGYLYRLNERFEAIQDRDHSLALPRPPFDQAGGFLKRESYALIRTAISKPRGASVIKYILRKEDLEPPFHRYTDNPYYWGLIAIDSVDDFLGAKRISRYAMQLNYAHKNNVPPAFLIGFLYQIGGITQRSQLIRTTGRDPSLNMQVLFPK